jgi:peptide/histidine transporter 3/4
VTGLCAAGASCVGGVASVFSTKTVAFLGLYLVAIGSGGVRSSLLPFGAEQFDDASAADRARKASFFSWFYLCVDFGPIVSGIFIVWIQENVSWGLGFGIATACIALAYGTFVVATPMYKRSTPTGTPLKSLCQVVVAACRKASLRLPSDAGLLHEVSDKDDSQPRLAHTSEFRFLDKAAILSELDLEERPLDEAVERSSSSSSWKLCTVTQVEQLKILLRLLPVWATSIIVSVAYSQMNTTFIQQGTAMDINVLSVSIPAASLGSFEVLCVLIWVLLYSTVIVPAMSASSSGEPSQLQRMGAGRLLMALSMAAAAFLEMKRLDAAARGEAISIAWQLPQYFLLAGGEVFCYIAQLEFFYSEAPDTMKSMCTSLALLTVALGSYMSSLIYAVLEVLTATADSPGWISDDLNKGHLDYFFWSMAAISIINLFVYSAFAKNYKLKTVLS